MVKVTDTRGITNVGKSKKSSKSNKASGVSFDSLVEKAGGVQNVEATENVAGVDAVESATEGKSTGFSVPEHAEERGNYMLDVLEELEKDILSGNESVAVEKLRKALDTKAIDVDSLSPKLKGILEEIEMRAAVEVAKIEESSK